jgi:hypothetical protein
MKKTHYTIGYGGKFNYTTFCGKEIHSHSEKEEATIDPTKVTCKKCLESKEWVDDYGYATGHTETDIKRRIYIESDILHASELERAQQTVMSLCEERKVNYIRRVFAEVLDYAWHDLEKTWNAVKRADEIYSDSSLLPLSGGSYMGAPVIFNGMCERAIKEGITGKDVYILNSIKNVSWDMIEIAVMKKAFKKNNLFMYNEDYEIIKVDVSKIKNK